MILTAIHICVYIYMYTIQLHGAFGQVPMRLRRLTLVRLWTHEAWSASAVLAVQIGDIARAPLKGRQGLL